jgi:hypothetical protein
MILMGYFTQWLRVNVRKSGSLREGYLIWSEEVKELLMGSLQYAQGDRNPESPPLVKEEEDVKTTAPTTSNLLLSPESNSD